MESITSNLKEIIADLTGIEPSVIKDQATLEDLGLDSLDIVEITMEVEEAFDIEIPDKDIEQISCFGQAISYIASRTNQPVHKYEPPKPLQTYQSSQKERKWWEFWKSRDPEISNESVSVEVGEADVSDTSGGDNSAVKKSEVKASNKKTPDDTQDLPYAKTILNAIEHNNEKLLEELLANGADPDSPIKGAATPLYLAVDLGRTEMVRILVGKGADVNKPCKGLTPIFAAVLNKNLAITKILLEGGADCNLQDEQGANTVLHLAAEVGSLEFVDLLLLPGGALPEIKNNEGATPLYLAAQNGHRSVLAKLIRWSADIETKGPGGFTPIYTAIENDRYEVVKLLVFDYRFDVNSKVNGVTPLHFAANFGRFEIAKYLVENGADVTLKYQGMTAAEIASKGGFHNIADLIQSPEDTRERISSTNVQKQLWQCPVCGGILEKKRSSMNLKDNVQGLLGNATCSYCSHSVQAEGVYNGQFDFADPDEHIRNIATDSGNMAFDENVKRWRYKGELVKLMYDLKEKESKSSLQEMIDAANLLNIGDAMNTVAEMYYRGLDGTEQNFSKAMEWYLKGAQLGDAECMYSLGYLYAEGKGIGEDQQMAFKWFTEAGHAGHAAAMGNVGIHYEWGLGIEQNFDKAAEWYGKGAEAGNLDATKNLASLYQKEQWPQKDYLKSLEWFEKAVEAGDIEAMNEIGILYKKGLGVSQDYKRAHDWYSQASQAGSKHAMHNIAMLYEKGLGVEQNLEIAAERYRAAANAGHTSSIYKMGTLYHFGTGVKKDYKRAIEWFKKAAKNEDFGAMTNIGYFYAHGYGVVQDHKKALEWYQKAADLGCDQAINNIGDAYEFGTGVEQDYEKAREFYLKACELGNAMAHFGMGSLYHHGRGVDNDMTKAKEYYQKAADMGDGEAKEILKTL